MLLIHRLVLCSISKPTSQTTPARYSHRFTRATVPSFGEGALRGPMMRQKHLHCLDARHFTSQTDYQPLVPLTKCVQDYENDRVICWRCRFTLYDFSVSGSPVIVAPKNTVADQLGFFISPHCALQLCLCVWSPTLFLIVVILHLRYSCGCSQRTAQRWAMEETLQHRRGTCGTRRSLNLADCTFHLEFVLELPQVHGHALAGHGVNNGTLAQVLLLG